MSDDTNLLRFQADDNTFNRFKVKLFIRGVQVKSSNITVLSISESIFSVLPTINLSFKDYGLFSDVFPLGDEDEIQVQISTHKDLEGIKTSFIIQDYSIIPTNFDNHQTYDISITGFLKNYYMLFPTQSQAFSRATSTDVLSQIFEDSGYTVVNPVKTNDTMTWLQANMNNLDMVNRVVDYAYKEDGTIVMAFVDKNNNAYIRDFITETKKPKTFDLKKSNDPISLYYSQLLGKEKKVSVLGYNYFRMGFHPGYNNKTGGYGVIGYAYDYNVPRIFKIKMNTDAHPITDYSLKLKDNVKINMFSEAEHMPMRYKGSNFHPNYHKAYLQNKYLRKTFFSDVMVVYSYFNDEVKLLDKINIDVNSLANSTEQSGEINKVYSGDALVVGIVNHIDNGGNYKSVLYLSRGGINQSAFVDKTEMKLNG